MFAFDGKEQTKPTSVKTNISFSLEGNNTIIINSSNLQSDLENYLKTAQNDPNKIFIIAYLLSDISLLKLPPTTLNNNQTIDPVAISNNIKRIINKKIEDMVEKKQFDQEVKKIIDIITKEINKPSGKYPNPWNLSSSISSFFESVFNGKINCPDPKTIYQEKDQITEAKQAQPPIIDLKKAIPKKNQEDQSLETNIDLNQSLLNYIRNVESIFFTFKNGERFQNKKSTVESAASDIADKLRSIFQGKNQQSEDIDKLRKAFMFFYFYYQYYGTVTAIAAFFTRANSSEDETNFQKIINFFQDLENGKKTKENIDLKFLYSVGDAFDLYFQYKIENLSK